MEFDRRMKKIRKLRKQLEDARRVEALPNARRNKAKKGRKTVQQITDELRELTGRYL